MVTNAAALHDHDQPGAERQLDEAVWMTLVDSVIEGKCTPFLGAGVASPHLPTGKKLATELAEEFGYPLPDPTNLPRVAQYIATVHDSPFAKRRVRDRIKARRDEFLASSGQNFPENYKKLSDLNLPIYLTTNYDDFLTRALKAADRTPRVEVCRWNGQLQEELEGYTKSQPTVQQPLIFHLHGELSNESSLLVTEDDYIDFTVSLGRQGESRLSRTGSAGPSRERRYCSSATALKTGISGS